VIGKASFHCRGHAQGFMHAAVIVVHKIQRNHVTMVLQFLADPFVSRVKLRIPILIERFWRSTNDVLIWSGSGLPERMPVRHPMQVAGL